MSHTNFTYTRFLAKNISYVLFSHIDFLINIELTLYTESETNIKIKTETKEIEKKSYAENCCKIIKMLVIMNKF